MYPVGGGEGVGGGGREGVVQVVVVGDGYLSPPRRAPSPSISSHDGFPSSSSSTLVLPSAAPPAVGESNDLL